MGVSKSRGKTPKMDGENDEKPMKTLLKWMIWGVSHIFGSTPICFLPVFKNKKPVCFCRFWLNISVIHSVDVAAKKVSFKSLGAMKMVTDFFNPK